MRVFVPSRNKEKVAALFPDWLCYAYTYGPSKNSRHNSTGYLVTDHLVFIEDSVSAMPSFSILKGEVIE